MAKKVKLQPRRKNIQLTFEAISIEGSLISPEWLFKVSQMEAPYQTEADYLILKGLNIRDEIGRYWRIANAYWTEFTIGTTQSPPNPSAAKLFIGKLLKDCFGYVDIVEQLSVCEIHEKNYPVTFLANVNLQPIAIAPTGLNQNIETLLPEFGDNGRKRSAFGLCQEFLNASDDATWGLVSDGTSLRILRDNSSLTRPAWIEIDIEKIFTEGLFADFTTFWLLAHHTRYRSSAQNTKDSIVEQWRDSSLAEGTRARNQLRVGVEQALETLGNGFLSNPGNQTLRTSIHSGTLSSQNFNQQLLRLVYRIIFLLTAEERNLLHPLRTLESVKTLYREGYSIQRLREKSVKSSSYDRHIDLWEGLKIVLKGLSLGQDRLGLPALGGLFSPNQAYDIDSSQLENKFLLHAIYNLSWLKTENGLSRINWRDMGSEELGSVYESLLELVPQISQQTTKFEFASGDEQRGNARKTSGSYYTPDSLVMSLLESALEPVIERTLLSNPGNKIESLLNLSIVDPACGSGHFLLAAARRLAMHIARIKTNGTPSSHEYREALRSVMSRCIFGVDKNPMAIELAKISFWLEAMSPNAPLSFVDHHLVVGDALIGLTSLDVLKKGVPSEAYKSLSGDDKEVAKRLSAKNKLELRSRALSDTSADQLHLAEDFMNTADALQELDALPDDTPNSIESKRMAFERIIQHSKNTENHPASLAADLFVSSFFIPKIASNESSIPTSRHIFAALEGQPIPEDMLRLSREICERIPVLHWRLRFANIFAKGGFDVILGNPPWERVKIQEQEFFSSRSPDIANARNQAARRILIDALGASPKTSAEYKLFKDFEDTKRDAEAFSTFAHGSERYLHTATGDINTYAVFSETAVNLCTTFGRVGIIVPSGIATDDSTKGFIGHLINGRLVKIVDFENRKALFPTVHRSTKFSLLTIGQAPYATYSCFLSDPSEEKDTRRQFRLSAEDIMRLNPNSGTCAVFRSEKDAEITKRIYSRVPVLQLERNTPNSNPWKVKFHTRLIHMSEDSELFYTANSLIAMGAKPSCANWILNDGTVLVPLYEAKMIHLFDHRWSTYEGSETSRELTPTEKLNSNFRITPQYWIPEQTLNDRLAAYEWTRPWLMGWRDITNSTNERTTIASVLPRAGIGNTIKVCFPGESSPAKCAALFINWSTLIFDFVARQKIGGTHLTLGYMQQLPTLPPEAYTESILEFILPRVLELTYTTLDLKQWAEELGFHGPPFPWNNDRRLSLRSELDAYFAALYGLSRDDLRYILDPSDIMGNDYPSETFRVLKEKELKNFGEYRTRRLVLEAFDTLGKNGQLPAPWK